MDLDDVPDQFAKTKIAELYESFPHAELRFSEFDDFASAHAREPHLGSGYNDKPQEGKGIFDVLCLYHKGLQIASLSFFLEKNKMKKQ